MEQILELLKQVEGDAHNLVILWVVIWFVKHVITCATAGIILCTMLRTIRRIARSYAFGDQVRKEAGMADPLCDSEKRRILACIRKGILGGKDNG